MKKEKMLFLQIKQIFPDINTTEKEKVQKKASELKDIYSLKITENKGISFEILLSSLKESSINLEILNFNFWHNKGNILYGVSNQISEKNYVKLILNIPYFKNEVYESCTNEIIKILSVTSGNLYKINQ